MSLNTKTKTKMKKILPLFLFLLFCMALFGQNTWYSNEKATVKQYLYFKVDTTNGMFSLAEKKSTLSPAIHSQVTSYSFDEPDFKIGARHYKGKGGRSALKVMGIQRKGEEEILSFDGKDIQVLEGDKRSDNIYVISNIAENHFEFGTEYRIILQKEFETDFNPAIPQKKMSSLWYTVPVVMAAGGWLVQQEMRDKSVDFYEAYEEAWRSGENEDNADVFLKEARERSRDADIVSISTAGCCTYYRRNTIQHTIEKK